MRLLPFLFMFVSISISAEESFKDFFGEWCVVKMDTFRGSIIPEEEAKNWLGTKVLISKNEFSSLSNVIYNPVYKLSVENLGDYEEGNIRQKDSVFYGVYPDRELVKKIEVYENKGEEYPYTYIEIVNSKKIFELYDGYVFTYERSCS